MVAPEERKTEFRTTVGGSVIKHFYAAGDISEESRQSLTEPGSYPFTRHVQPTGYRGRLWTMRQYAGFGTVEETNQRYKYLFRQGTTGFSVAFHLPTQQRSSRRLDRVSTAIARHKYLPRLRWKSCSDQPCRCGLS